MDPDGTIASYLWTKILGPASSTIISSQASQTMIKNLTKGVYQFELRVTDNLGAIGKDTMLITVNDAVQTNRPPVACAGADQTITLPANTVNLDGSCSTDPDNNITSYVWRYASGPSGFNIFNANSAQTQAFNFVQGIYQIELKVTDAGGLFSRDTMQVTVNAAVSLVGCNGNIRPQINARLIPIGTISQPRAGMEVASVNNKIVFAGGGYVTGSPTSSRVDIFDISSYNWATAELSQARWGIAAAVLGNKVFFAGGGGNNSPQNYYDNVDIYDASNNSWTLAHLSEPRSLLAGATVGNKVFFAGGTSNGGNYDANNKVDIYDQSTNIWSTAFLSQGRYVLSAVTVGSSMYYGGGSDRAHNSVNALDTYDNPTRTW